MNYQDVEIVDLLELHSAVIGDVFPGLRQHAARPIDQGLLDQRSITTLKRRGCATWGDLGACTVGDLWAVPHAGRLTVERILVAARAKAAQWAAPGSNWPPPVPGSGIGAPAPNERRQILERFRARVEMLADWTADAHGATDLGGLLDALVRPLPADVAAAVAEVRKLALGDLLLGFGAPPASDLIKDFLTKLGSDARFVIERHIASPAGRPRTLEAVAEGAGITRERVRQIVKRGVDRADSLRQDPRFRPLIWRSEALRDVLVAASPVESMSAQAAIERAASGFDDPEGCTAADFMLWFAGGYRSFEGWWVAEASGGVDMLRATARAVLEREWLLRRSHLVEAAQTAGFAGDLDDRHLAEVTGWRSIGDEWWLRWDGSLGDKAERILRLALTALRPEELNDLIGEGHAKSSVQNVLSSDPRFTRVSMDLRFALTEWGWEEYSTAAQEIAERIERAGGEAVLDDIVVELFNQFGLKEATVRAYAASPAFVNANGRIRLRRADERVEVNDRIASVSGLYVAPDGSVIYHVRIDSELLRGSGRSAPSPLAVALGVRPGGARDFVCSDGGRVRITWPDTSATGPSLGSIRSIAERLATQLGDVVRLTFTPKLDTVCASKVEGHDLQALTGLSLTPGAEMVELAAALNVPPADVRSTLADRGDDQVASLMPHPAVSTGLDAALSRLDGLLG